MTNRDGDFIVALDKKTGRNSGRNHATNPPCPRLSLSGVQNKFRFIVSATGKIRSYDL